jgi:hypothetical protein
MWESELVLGEFKWPNRYLMRHAWISFDKKVSNIVVGSSQICPFPAYRRFTLPLRSAGQTQGPHTSLYVSVPYGLCNRIYVCFADVSSLTAVSRLLEETDTLIVRNCLSRSVNIFVETSRVASIVCLISRLPSRPYPIFLETCQLLQFSYPSEDWVVSCSGLADQRLYMPFLGSLFHFVTALDYCCLNNHKWS